MSDDLIALSLCVLLIMVGVWIGMGIKKGERIPATVYEAIGAYADFDRSNAAIQAILETYVVPLYT